ncbi:MAG: tRNA uridine-5-carboxymethylaminomethyl(34) synthesis enzyme MnmG [Candidatus Marinimicrobia bacterium]|nr:tRNA uridine-5-carboxymethylaminomethyl(34) synthesis enzyme MnmG [Candidatus Neomarinimicrobiota bacterium]
MKHKKTHYDIIVVGAGHSGIEAALSASRIGCSVGLITINPSAVGRMSCNPAIGGLAKGQMVREIDVFGGMMGLAADSAGLQFKMLNRSKGKAVWSPRAQVDKRAYERFVVSKINNSPTVSLICGEVIGLMFSHYSISGVVLRGGKKILAKSVVLTCGTFLNGLVHIGERKIHAGRMGESPAVGITEFLVSEGFISGRLKTGTPPRLIANSVNWEKLVVSSGDDKPTPFSYRTSIFEPPNVPCYIAQTNPDCHEIIHRDILLSPMFSGDVSGTGPRYCPSIEDKVHRFAHRKSHSLFLEPEWLNSNQIYANGFSTSLPEKTQLNALKKIIGLENVEFFRPGYAIEYDFFPSLQLKSSLETKNIFGLFFAGQINGTSGYEEAAAQGLIAGANASFYVLNKDPLLLSRNEAYIGVLIDDLITKESYEPYRMFTSRAEYRILIRYSSAGDRLVQKSFDFGLITSETYDIITSYLEITKQTTKALNSSLLPTEMNNLLTSLNEPCLKQKTPACDVLKRPIININHLPKRLFEKVELNGAPQFFIDEMMREAEILIKYKGYIDRQHREIMLLKNQETKTIPLGFDYFSLKNISNEAKEKLSLVRPETLGQALRVSGVSPADAAVLAVHLHR